ncbi:MAG: FKBP-type peptidyl-prolyl cis-trans isomerase [Muribaculaceae bacterium]|nr:FKBP-type peptidyl-prolyl cis-trans isomerase [Muribaculaceae bacterium]
MAFTAEEAEAYLNAYVEGLMPKEEALSLESQQEFLDKQLSRPGVIKTASGLVFETVKEGTGRSPKLTDKVRVLYKGRLADGTVFDSTDNEGPIEFDVNRLVKGFTEGLLLMREGGQYRLFIPASLGYGERGAGGVIPPNAALDFEVTLIEIINQ